MVTVAPEGMGIALNIPPNSMEPDSDAKPTFSFRLCSSSEFFVYPAGIKLVSPVYHISSNTTPKEDFELIVEHTADIETSEQAENMAFFVGRGQGIDGKVHFTLKKGKFEVKKEHGSLMTDQTGFVSIGTTEPSNMSETVLPKPSLPKLSMYNRYFYIKK